MSSQVANSYKSGQEHTMDKVSVDYYIICGKQNLNCVALISAIT